MLSFIHERNAEISEQRLKIHCAAILCDKIVHNLRHRHDLVHGRSHLTDFKLTLVCVTLKYSAL